VRSENGDLVRFRELCMLRGEGRDIRVSRGNPMSARRIGNLLAKYPLRGVWKKRQ